MMKSCNSEFELLCELSVNVSMHTTVEEYLTYPHEIVQVDSFVAMNLDFHSPSKNVNKSFPSQVFRERRIDQCCPVAAQYRITILVLCCFDLSSFIVTEDDDVNDGIRAILLVLTLL